MRDWKRSRDETISIVVDSTLWATQLRYLEDDIVERANALVGSASRREFGCGSSRAPSRFRREFQPVWPPFRGVLW